jgi:large subunit ribosomal protein L25
MKSFTINGDLRAAQSKQELKKLRAEGKVPCVLYGGNEQVHFSAPVLDFRHLVYTPEVYTVNVNVNGKSHTCIMKEIQFHPVTDALMHIDFLELFEDKPVSIEVPVKVSGNSVGVRAGGVLVNKMRKLKISALPKHLPDYVEVKIDNLNIGDDIRVRDLSMDGVTFIDSPSNVIASVKTTRAVAATETAAPATQAAATPAAAAPKK